MRLRPLLLQTLFLILALAAGCSSAIRSRESAVDPLLPSLQVYTESGEVTFVLQVTNIGSAPVDLDFSSGQSFDFLVQDEAGAEIWKWSTGQMFTQAERRESLAGGASLRYEGQWNPDAGIRGNLIAVGRLTTRNYPVEQAIRFQLH